MRTLHYRKFGIEGSLTVPGSAVLALLPIFDDWFPDHDYCAWYDQGLPCRPIRCHDGDWLLLEAGLETFKVGIRQRQDDEHWDLTLEPMMPTKLLSTFIISDAVMNAVLGENRVTDQHEDEVSWAGAILAVAMIAILTLVSLSFWSGDPIGAITRDKGLPPRMPMADEEVRP